MALNAVADRYPVSANINAATNNIPTAFSTAAGSNIMNGLSGANSYSHCMALNQTSGMISICFSPIGVTPSSSSTARLYLEPNQGAAWDDLPIFDGCYIQSESGSTLSTGSVQVMVW